MKTPHSLPSSWIGVPIPSRPPPPTHRSSLPLGTLPPRPASTTAASPASPLPEVPVDAVIATRASASSSPRAEAAVPAPRPRPRRRRPGRRPFLVHLHEPRVPVPTPDVNPPPCSPPPLSSPPSAPCRRTPPPHRAGARSAVASSCHYPPTAGPSPQCPLGQCRSVQALGALLSARRRSSRTPPPRWLPLTPRPASGSARRRRCAPCCPAPSRSRAHSGARGPAR